MNLKNVASNQTEVELASGVTVFFSYSTPVAAHIPGEGFVKTEQNWSRTTAKHIGQFVRRHTTAAVTVAVKPQSFFDALS